MDILLKARNPVLYYGNLHIEYYYFYQQCKNHFEIVEAKDYKFVSFTVTFLKDRILNQWQQHKTQTKRNQSPLLSWEEFKAFLKKSLGKSDAFIGHV